MKSQIINNEKHILPMGLVKCVHISHCCMMESCGGGLVVAQVAICGVRFSEVAYSVKCC